MRLKPDTQSTGAHLETPARRFCRPNLFRRRVKNLLTESRFATYGVSGSDLKYGIFRALADCLEPKSGAWSLSFEGNWDSGRTARLFSDPLYLIRDISSTIAKTSIDFNINVKKEQLGEKLVLEFSYAASKPVDKAWKELAREAMLNRGELSNSFEGGFGKVCLAFETTPLSFY